MLIIRIVSISLLLLVEVVDEDEVVDQLQTSVSEEIHQEIPMTIFVQSLQPILVQQTQELLILEVRTQVRLFLP